MLHTSHFYYCGIALGGLYVGTCEVQVRDTAELVLSIFFTLMHRSSWTCVASVEGTRLSSFCDWSRKYWATPVRTIFLDFAWRNANADP